MSAQADVWAQGAAYEPYIGRWSRLVAREFLNWLGVAGRSRWIDVGCGTGALTETILNVADPERIHSFDASESYVSYARRAIVDSRVEFQVADALALPDRPDSADVAVSGLVLNFVAQPERMLNEMTRVVRAGGTVAAYVWDYAGEMQLIRRFWDAAVELDPSASVLDEGRRFPICNLAPLTKLWQAAGLRSVEARPIDVPTRFQNFDDYWQPFLGGQGPAPGYAMGLDEPRRSALREALRARLPSDANGCVELIARAWAIRGAK